MRSLLGRKEKLFEIARNGKEEISLMKRNSSLK